MIVTTCKVKNFASYKDLEFNFDSQGLTLVSGPTGAGKSTLCDVIPWILFGITSKGGAVDEIMSWRADSPTEGLANINIKDKTLVVCRIRGNKANDLWFLPEGAINPIRGKDLKDTQELLNSYLGITAELYLSGAYLQEFSQAASFFTVNAKSRRAITEQLVDLTLPKTLLEQLSLYKKELKSEINSTTSQLEIKQNELKLIESMLIRQSDRQIVWEENRTKDLILWKKSSSDFELNKQKHLAEMNEFWTTELCAINAHIEQLKKTIEAAKPLETELHRLEDEVKLCGDTTCTVCGANTKNLELLVLNRELNKARSALDGIQRIEIELVSIERQKIRHHGKPLLAIQEYEQSTNQYQARIKETEALINPYIEEIVKLKEDKSLLKIVLSDLQETLNSHKVEQSDVELLISINDTFRAELIKSAISNLEADTNDLLTRHFDAEIRVSFEIVESDKLEVHITKDGNVAHYTQLSKGQRQLLKLCYGLSVMKAIQNHHNVSFNAVFLDEPFDGISEEMRLKSFNLLVEVSTKYDSAFCVEHNETMKAMFDSRYDVELIDGWSKIEKSI